MANFWYGYIFMLWMGRVCVGILRQQRDDLAYDSFAFVSLPLPYRIPTLSDYR
jgi:hypothetical protein